MYEMATEKAAGKKFWARVHRLCTHFRYTLWDTMSAINRVQR